MILRLHVLALRTLTVLHVYCFCVHTLTNNLNALSVLLKNIGFHFLPPNVLLRHRHTQTSVIIGLHIPLYMSLLLKHNGTRVCQGTNYRYTDLVY